MVAIKVVLSLPPQKKKKKQPCDSPLKGLVNHQPERHSTSPLVSSTREGGEGGRLSVTGFLSDTSRSPSHSTGPGSYLVKGRSKA